MAQEAIEIILTRQLAGYLSTPMFLVDPHGTLLFVNEPAEQILGQRFDEMGDLGARDWSTMFRPTTADGSMLSTEDLPLVITIRERRPSHSEFWIVGLDQVPRHIEVTALPLIGLEDRFLGGIALIWEVP